MTQEEKQLLLKDLCARLPYGVIADFKIGLLTRMKQVVEGWWLDKINDESFKFIKPYLRPMSSMTEEEEIYYNTIYTTLKFYEKEDWLNANHFDYRGLIPMGLALEASKDMYKIR